MFQKSSKKNKILHVRITEEQKKVINDLASKDHKTISEFILSLIQNYIDNNKL